MKTLTLLALGALTLVPAFSAPLRSIPGLTTIRFFEVSGVNPTQVNFAAQNGPMDIKLLNPPALNNNDHASIQAEYFDLYYSDANGNFNLNGEYITIDCFMDNEISGCNVADLQLFYGSTPGAFADVLTRFVTAPGYVNGSQLLAIDGNTSTFARLGSSDTAIMSLTVGFSGQLSNPVPEPSTYAMMGAGLIGLCYFNKKRK